MRIAVLIDRLNIGGVEKIAIEEVRSLTAAGIDAELVVMRRKSVVENAFPDLLSGVKVTYLDDRLPALCRFSFNFPLFYFFSLFHLTYPVILPFVVKKGEYDYLISHGTYTALTAIQLKKRSGIPFSGYIWDPITYLIDRVYQVKIPRLVYIPLRYVAKLLDTYIARSMNSILVGGVAHNSFLRDIAPGKHINLIYPSVHPAKKPYVKKPYALVMTAWKEGKNPEYILELVRALPTLRIKMAGKWIDSDYRKRFEALVRDNDFQNSIEVLGAVSEKELSRLYGEALTVLQTNDDRGFGMPALEAASQATTFIIPEGQGVCDLFEEGIHGYYTKEMDTAKIVSLLGDLMKNEEKAKLMGKTAWEHVRNLYSWDNHAENLIRAVNEALSTTLNEVS